jgi:hypothetical protein
MTELLHEPWTTSEIVARTHALEMRQIENDNRKYESQAMSLFARNKDRSFAASVAHTERARSVLEEANNALLLAEEAGRSLTAANFLHEREAAHLQRQIQEQCNLDTFFRSLKNAEDAMQDLHAAQQLADRTHADATASHWNAFVAADERRLAIVKYKIWNCEQDKEFLEMIGEV